MCNSQTDQFPVLTESHLEPGILPVVTVFDDDFLARLSDRLKQINLLLELGTTRGGQGIQPATDTWYAAKLEEAQLHYALMVHAIVMTSSGSFRERSRLVGLHSGMAVEASKVVMEKCPYHPRKSAARQLKVLTECLALEWKLQAEFACSLRRDFDGVAANIAPTQQLLSEMFSLSSRADESSSRVQLVVAVMLLPFAIRTKLHLATTGYPMSHEGPIASVHQVSGSLMDWCIAVIERHARSESEADTSFQLKNGVEWVQGLYASYMVVLDGMKR